MLNFDYHNPTHIVFGKGRLKELNSLVPKEARVLITYGGGSVTKTGVLDRVKQALAKSPRQIFEFGGISANPQLSVLKKAINIVREKKIDFLLALGGGSVMDGTKFIALASPAEKFKGKEEELLGFGFTPVPVDHAVALGTVVTMPATGSEMNFFAVISHGKDKLPVCSPHAFPKFSILDPELTFTLPPAQVANGVVDTFIHTLEQYVTFPVDARFQDRTAEGILQTLIEIGPTTIEEPDNYDARANLVWCATMALNSLIGSGVPQDWNTHMIGHEITAMFGLDHARTLAIIQPAVWKIRREQKKEKLLQYASRVWNITHGSEDQRIDAAIARTEEFFQALGMKTRLTDHGITKADIPNLVNALEAHGMTALSETGDVTLEVSKEILTAAL